MIQPQEIRLGNFLKLKDSYIESSVEAITYAQIQMQGNLVLNRIEQLEPILLTKVWLMKFGFKKEEGLYSKDGLRLTQVRDLYWRANFPIKADVVSIHQLQNLYFALIGKELEVI